MQEALLSNSCTHFQSAFFCAAFFQAGLKRCSSRLGLRIDLISICFKSEAMARGGLVQRAKSCEALQGPKYMTVMVCGQNDTTEIEAFTGRVASVSDVPGN